MEIAAVIAAFVILAAITVAARSMFQSRAHGFVFVPDAEDGPMRSAEVGATIRNVDSDPPWIVVDHAIESIIAEGWPGRLWKVSILEAAGEQPIRPARYTRAVAVRVLEELPTSILFGAHGEEVCRVIERAARVSVEDVRLLAEAARPAAREAYSQAWNRWLGEVEPDSPNRGQDHSDTLAVILVPGGARFPIGVGLTVLYSVLSDRARSLVGDVAFVVDEEGDQSFAPEWAAVSDAFLQAAMALGAPQLMSTEERELLLSAWKSVQENGQYEPR
jgi:hypothetical protein